jgi:Xaa-Pro dipeptidase
MQDRDDLPFSMSEYRARLQAVRGQMQSRGLDLLIVTTPENMYYITGYSGLGFYTYQALLLPLEGEAAMVTRHLEADNVRWTSWLETTYDYRDEEDPEALTKQALSDMGMDKGRIGVEKNCWWLTIESYENLVSLMSDAEFIDATGTVEQLRLIKSEKEIEYTRRAASAAGEAMHSVLEAIQEGVPDSELAAVIYATRTRAGSEYVADIPLCPTGPKSGLAHATWEGRKIENGDVIFLEFGAAVERYHAGLMRSAVIGSPSALVQRAAEASMTALTRAIEAMKPGVTAGELDDIARHITTQAGLSEYHHHRLGYHIGIAFPPVWVQRSVFSLNTGVPDLLKPGMIFHLVPALLIPGVGGIGNSETVLVTEDGAERLTDFELSLFVK